METSNGFKAVIAFGSIAVTIACILLFIFIAPDRRDSLNDLNARLKERCEAKGGSWIYIRDHGNLCLKEIK